MSENGNGRKDVTVKVPVGRVGVRAPGGKITTGPSLDEPPSAEELCGIYYQALKAEKAEKSELADFCRGVSSLCLSLVKMLVDHGTTEGLNEVTVPKWLHQQMLGASIEVTNLTNGDIRIRLRESGPERVVPGL